MANTKKSAMTDSGPDDDAEEGYIMVPQSRKDKGATESPEGERAELVLQLRRDLKQLLDDSSAYDLLDEGKSARKQRALPGPVEAIFALFGKEFHTTIS